MEKREEEGSVWFNIDRRSSIASKLKSSISDQLFHFLGDFTDDVLAEYITVLVCNGKDQIQAKHDLEAFLGERSSAFISWLWDHLLRIGHDADKDLKSNRSSSAGRSLTENCKNSQKTSRDSPNVRELSESSEKSRKYVRTYKEQLHSRRSISREAVDITEKHGGDRRAKSIESADIHKNENEKAGVQISDFPRRLKSLESYNVKQEEVPPASESTAANITAEIPFTTFPDAACERKVRGSVWDRLGKPWEEKPTVNSLEPCSDQVKKHHQAQDQPKLVSSSQNENFNSNTEDGVHYLDRSSLDRKFEQKNNTIVKPYSENNIRPKRTYSEINSNCTSLSVSVDHHYVDGSLKEKSIDSKKLNSSTEMKGVRQKLHEIEMEMSKLRSKQLGLSKRQSPVPLNSGAPEYSVRDINSRTVFTSNVHFAATKQVLSSHFAKCGWVSSVTFSKTVKGSAYITFSSKDSVEKALALNGTSFMSRLLKVVKKGEEISLTTSQIPLGAVKSSMRTQKPVPKTGITSLEESFNPSRVHHNLQWRRDPISATSEPSQA